MNNKSLGILYALGTCIIYSIMSLITKLAKEASPIVLIFFKSLICVFILSIYFFKKNTSWKLNNKKLIFFRIFFGFLNLICLYYAIKNLPLLVDAALLTDTGNLFTPLIIFFWDKIYISKIRILAILTGFIGTAIILRPSFHYFNFAGIIGLFSGLSIGFINVIVKKLSKTESTNVIILYFFMSNIILSFFPTIYCWKTFENPITWVYIVALGILAFLFQLFFIKACSMVSLTKLNALFYSGTLFTAFFEWVFFKRIPDIYTIFGGLLIITGGIIAYEKSIIKNKKMCNKLNLS